MLGELNYSLLTICMNLLINRADGLQFTALRSPLKHRYYIQPQTQSFCVPWISTALSINYVLLGYIITELTDALTVLPKLFIYLFGS